MKTIPFASNRANLRSPGVRKHRPLLKSLVLAYWRTPFGAEWAARRMMSRNTLVAAPSDSRGS